MDNLTNSYSPIICHIFQEYIDFFGTSSNINMEIIVDLEKQRYLLIETGWQNGYRIYGVFLHIDTIDGKLWIQHDGSEEGIADELVKAGIPKDKIVLAYKPLENRKLTEFAVS